MYYFFLWAVNTNCVQPALLLKLIHLDSAFANTSNTMQVKIHHEMEKANYKHMELMEQLQNATKVRPRRVPETPQPAPPQYEVESEEEVEVDE